MFNREITPYAPALVESMRSLGYTFNAALSDLIDNSVSAGSKKIDIYFETEPTPIIMIVDDGCGMSSDKLESAMRYGSKNPDEIREKSDLGRYGLGMKSASLSQCKVLLVISKTEEDGVCAYEWNLDHLQQTKKWSVIGYEKHEIVKFNYIDKLLANQTGTMLILTEFDRIQNSTKDLKKTFEKKFSELNDHLELVFHNFITNSGLKISINGRVLKARDPYLPNNPKRQLLEEQQIKIANSIIRVKGVILPYVKDMTPEEKISLGGTENLNTDQGFYIYRENRLIIWGTWFRLVGKDSLSKYARIRVDIPNTLDYLWEIDVKKSQATLPDSIKKQLIATIDGTIFRSVRVVDGRAKKEVGNNAITSIWNRTSRREGFEYTINRKLPLIQLLEKVLEPTEYKHVKTLLKLIETNLPFHMMHVDMSKDKIEMPEKQESNILIHQVMEAIESATLNGLDRESLLKMYLKQKPYSDDQEVINAIKCELENK